MPVSEAAIELVRDFLSRKPARPLVVILGPTASGKTALAIAVARACRGEIVNADSRQIYRRIPIGSAAPTAEECAAAPHHLVEIREPDETVTAVEYRQLAEKKIREIESRGNLPILAGGHMLAISAIVANYQFPAGQPDPALRAELQARYDSPGGPAKLWSELEKLDPATAARTPATNPHAVIRALELGEKLKTKAKAAPEYDLLLIGIRPDRAALHAKINARFDAMLTAGLIEEARELFAEFGPASPKLPALTGQGYPELFAHFRGEMSLAEAAEKAKTATRQYARRQLTWWRNCDFAEQIHWLEP